ncbi:hypothetical protein HC256_006668 [Beauveria bassiana]|nr:hypothetical protein HC256_006668 [Beauveria bassiana]
MSTSCKFGSSTCLHYLYNIGDLDGRVLAKESSNYVSSAAPGGDLNILPHKKCRLRRDQRQGDGKSARWARHLLPAPFCFPPAPANAAKDVTCIVSGLEPVAHSGLPTAWRIQKIVRTVAHRAVFPVILLHEHVLAQSDSGALLPGKGVLAHRSVQEILDVRAVDVVGLARQGADEAHAPVVNSEQRHDVGAFVAKELSLLESRPAWSFRTYMSMDAVFRPVVKKCSAVEAELFDPGQVHDCLEVVHLRCCRRVVHSTNLSPQ